MIRIYLGARHAEASGSATSALLEKPDGYASTRIQIRDALRQGESLDVIVLHRACDGWFWDLGQYPSVELVQADPRQQLCRKLACAALPPEFENNPDLILELGLLNLPEPAEPVNNVWDWVLTELVGRAWTQRNPSFEHLTGLVAHLARDRAGLTGPPAVMRKCHERADEWLAGVHGDLSMAYKWVLHEPAQRAAALVAIRNLGPFYQSELDSWLGQIGLEAPDGRWIVDRLGDLALPDWLAAQLSPRAEAYWRGSFLEGVTVETALANVSGLLEGELSAFSSYFSEHLAVIKRTDLEQLRIRFASLPRTNGVVGELIASLPPPLPDQPAPDWSFERWMDWATSAYIPYKKWSIDQKEAGNAARSLGLAYEDWLFKTFPTLLADPEKLVFGTYRVIDRYLESDTSLIWVLIDNLPVFLVKVLADAFTREGFVLVQPPSYLVSMLPSETSVSRLAALAGRLPIQITDGISERDAFSERWGSKASVAESIEDLVNVLRESPQLCLVVYNQVDFAAHRHEHMVTNRADEIRNGLMYLASKLRGAADIVAGIRKVRLVVSTDHGSTRLPSTAERVGVPPSAVRDDIFEKHKRFIRVSNLASLNRQDWFPIAGREFGLHRDYGIVRGERYIDSRPTSYTHGGLSAEETVTPVLVWELGEAPAVTILELAHSGEPILRGRRQKLQLTLQNLSRLPLRDIQLFLPGVGGHASIQEIPPLTAISSPLVEVTLPEKLPLDRGTARLDATATFVAGGAERSQIFKLPVKVRELFKTEADDFMKMFNE